MNNIDELRYALECEARVQGLNTRRDPSGNYHSAILEQCWQAKLSIFEKQRQVLTDYDIVCNADNHLKVQLDTDADGIPYGWVEGEMEFAHAIIAAYEVKKNEY